MTVKDQRFCINCGDSYERQDAGAEFVFCPSCNSGLATNRAKNDLILPWAIGRKATSSDKSIADGQCDQNWPDGFPSRKPLRNVHTPAQIACKRSG